MVALEIVRKMRPTSHFLLRSHTDVWFATMSAVSTASCCCPIFINPCFGGNYAKVLGGTWHQFLTQFPFILTYRYITCVGSYHFRIEYFTVIDKTVIKFLKKMMMGNSRDREDSEKTMKQMHRFAVFLSPGVFFPSSLFIILFSSLFKRNA